MLSVHLLITLSLCIYYTAGQSIGDLRVAVGQIVGRLEVYYNDTWGTVCDDGFDDIDAQVSCKELGFSSGKTVGNLLPGGSGKIWLDDVACRGTESRLSSCGHYGWGQHNCGHHEDVGIDCRVNDLKVNNESTILSNVTYSANSCDGGFMKRNNKSNVDGSDNCFSTETKLNASRTVCCVGDLRVVNDTISGRLEVYYNDEWGTVCGDRFDDTDATVACKQLGFDFGLVRSINQLPGIGSNRTWLNEVACLGNESRLIDCGHSVLGTNNCGHSKDVNITCSEKQIVNGGWSIWSYWNEYSTNCGPVRRIRTRYCNNPPVSKYGEHCIGDPREEIFCNNLTVNGGWSIWSNWNDCTAICGGGLQTRVRYCNNPHPINGEYCNGNTTEARLCNTVGCAVNGGWSIWSNWTDCSTTSGVGFQTKTRLCNNPLTATGGKYCYGNATDARLCNVAGDLRVVGGQFSGRLEVYNNEWGTVCDYGFSDTDAQVACKQLGFGSGKSIGNTVEMASGKIWLYNVSCRGTENNFSICDHNGWGKHNCYHGQDVGIECTIKQAGDGNWSIWSNWSDCTTTCGGGLQTRIRLCNNPPAAYGGEYCNGNATEARLCNTMFCPASTTYVVLIALGSAAASACFILIGLCIYNRRSKDEEHKVVRKETCNEYMLQNMGNDDNSLQDKTKGDIYENTEELYEIMD